MLFFLDNLCYFLGDNYLIPFSDILRYWLLLSFSAQLAYNYQITNTILNMIYFPKFSFEQHDNNEKLNMFYFFLFH
jgi:hypothetical protein